MPAPRWIVPPDARLEWRHWDDEYVVYHVQSGDTHRLTAVSARALEHLQHSPLDAAALAERLATETHVAADAAFVDAIERLVSDLCDVGLVEPVDESA